MEPEDEGYLEKVEKNSFSERNPLLSSILRTSPNSISPSGLLPTVENRKRRIDQTSIVSDEENHSEEFVIKVFYINIDNNYLDRSRKTTMRKTRNSNIMKTI